MKKLIFQGAVARTYFTPEHCFARCFAALFTHFRLELHSISQTRLRLRHANCPAGRLLSPSGDPKMLEGATREKFFRLFCPERATLIVWATDRQDLTPLVTRGT